MWIKPLSCQIYLAYCTYLLIKPPLPIPNNYVLNRMKELIVMAKNVLICVKKKQLSPNQC